MTALENPALHLAAASAEERTQRLEAGADQLVARASLTSHRAFVPALAATLMTSGFTAILLGWYGASQSIVSEEQTPYLISGGILGLALSVTGALLFFAHWSARDDRAREMVRAHDHAEVLEALRSIERALTRLEASDGSPRSDRAERPLRRTPRSR